MEGDEQEGSAASPGTLTFGRGGAVNEMDKGKTVKFYVVAGMGTVVIGRIALFSHSVVNRAGSIVMLIVIALCTAHMVSLQRRSKR